MHEKNRDIISIVNEMRAQLFSRYSDSTPFLRRENACVMFIRVMAFL